MPQHRIPASTLAEIAELDDAEVLEGYRDGFKGEPCGDNRSASFWHGWRNGMVDSGRATKDEFQAALAREFVEETRGSHLRH